MNYNKNSLTAEILLRIHKIVNRILYTQSHFYQLQHDSGKEFQGIK